MIAETSSFDCFTCIIFLAVVFHIVGHTRGALLLHRPNETVGVHQRQAV